MACNIGVNMKTGITKEMLDALKELLRQVDIRCGGKAEGSSALVRAADEARAVIAKAEGR